MVTPKKQDDSSAADNTSDDINDSEVKANGEANHDANKGDDSQHSGLLENLGRRLDEIPEIKLAEEAVLKAKQELEKALNRCREMQKNTSATVSDLRQKSIGQLLDDTLDYVRKHPAQGLFLSGLIGMLIGKWFRR